MLISREVDYAVRIVLLLCQSSEKIDAKEIAAKTGISLRFTLKILGKLTSSKLVKSFRGAKGGYIISKSPKEISVYDIVEILEDDIKINGCFSEKTNCDDEKIKSCRLRHKLAGVSLKIRKELEKITMDKLGSC